jgi:hypothetical protein
MAKEDDGLNIQSQIHWGRDLAAGLLSEVAVVAVLGLIFAAHRFLIAPGRTKEEYQAFVDRASYVVAPTAAGIAVFLAALWAARTMNAGFIVNGVVVGVIGVVLTLAFFFGAKPEQRLMYGVSFALRILGGYLGGVAAQHIV